MKIGELERISLIAHVNSDRPEKLAELRNEKPKVEAQTVQTATFNFLDSLVQERVEQIQASQAASRQAEAERVQAAERAKNAELRSQFKTLIEKGAATVNNGTLQFQHDGTAYTVFMKDGAFVLNGGQIKEMKLTGDGDNLNKLVNTLASLRAF